MPGRKTRGGESQAWIVDDVSQEARQQAEQAAARTGVPLEIWLAETVLRASQEGVGTPDASNA